MQDPASTFHQAMMKPQFPEQEQLKCPRCDSNNTKFCYYNNYNLSQPRHFCKNCRRYWTKGGALRNIPVGGGSRKNTKRSSNNPKRHANPSDPNPTRRIPEPGALSSATSQQMASNQGVVGSGLDQDPNRVYGLSVEQDRKVLDMSMNGSFSSLLASNGRLGSMLEGMNPNGSGLKMVEMSDLGENLGSGHGVENGIGLQGNNNGSDSGGGESYSWSGSSNGWPDLAIYTPGSNYQ